MEDKRHFTRISFDAEAYLQAGAQGWDTQVLDISLHGVLVSVPPDCLLAPDAGVILTLTLTDQVTCIVMQGHTRYACDGRLGIECDQLDVDSACHLRRLVELNMGDERLLEREFESLWRIRDCP